MKKTLLIAVTALSLVFAVTACCGGGETTSTGGDSAEGGGDVPEGFSKVPNSDGLLAKVPDNAKPNGVGGAAGFHSDDKSFSFTVREEKAKKSMADAKKAAESFLFKEWIASEEMEGGYVLTWKSPKMDMSGDEPKEVGVMYSFEVLKDIDGKAYKCTGAVEKEEGMKAAVEACKSLQKG